MRAMLPQQCPVAMVYFTAVVYVGAGILLAFVAPFPMLIAWLAAVPLFLWVYVRVFPRISSAMGYGSVTDRNTAADVPPAPARVTLYTGLGCPFCPIVESRLQALRPRMGFELQVVDVTARPDVAAREHIRALPVVVVDGRRRAGCATTDELAALIAGTPAEVPVGVS